MKQAPTNGSVRQMTRRVRKFIAAVALTGSLCASQAGCVGQWARVSKGALTAAEAANNNLVATLNAVQSAARESRRSIMKQIARSATSREAGIEALDEVDESFKPVWVALANAEIVQRKLATSISLARIAIDSGREPTADDVIRLFAELQTAQAAVSESLVRAR